MSAVPASTLGVVVFTYNHARFLRDTLAGICAQSRRPDRILVCDDASPADSEAELAAIVAEFPGVELHRNAENLGAVVNFRQGIERVGCDAYMLHAGDDRLVDPDFLRDAEAILQAHPSVVVVHGMIRRASPDGTLLGADLPRADRPYRVLSGDAMRRRLAYINPVAAPCTVIRRSVHAHVPPFPIPSRARHDWQQWFLLSYFGDFARIERPVMESFVHGDNLSVGRKQNLALHRALRKDYEDLLARPEIRPEDAERLRAGLLHLDLQGTPIRELGEVLWHHRSEAGVARELGHTLARRLGMRLLDFAARGERAAIEQRVGGRLDLAVADERD